MSQFIWPFLTCPSHQSSQFLLLPPPSCSSLLCSFLLFLLLSSFSSSCLSLLLSVLLFLWFSFSQTASLTLSTQCLLLLLLLQDRMCVVSWYGELVSSREILQPNFRFQIRAQIRNTSAVNVIATILLKRNKDHGKQNIPRSMHSSVSGGRKSQHK